MALLNSNLQALPIGSTAPVFSLKGTDGKRHSLKDIASGKANLILFMCNHCPYVKAVRERINALRAAFPKQDLVIIGINSNDAEEYPDDSFEQMQEFHKLFPVDYYLIDETQSVAKAYGAVCTPDPYLFDSSLKLVYHGRIDDGYLDPVKVTVQDLKHAIGATILGKPISEKPHPSMGCSIKWKQ